LVARGYDDDSIAKILGENWLSVLEKGGKNQ
jgi:microsomal dipeptidase-like Zn-dependent dipeptidase